MARNYFESFQLCAKEEMPGAFDYPEVLKSAVQKLRRDYDFSLNRILDVDFDVPRNRAAYLFRYATNSTHITYYVLQLLKSRGFNLALAVEQWPERNFNITSLGSGPGCDLLAILTFLGSETCYLRSLHPITVNAIEKYMGWKNVLERIMGRVRNPPTSCTYNLQDFARPLTDEVGNILRSTDLLTMVLFVSAFEEVSAVEEERRIVQERLKDVMQLLPEGAMILFIDVSGGSSFFLVLNTCQSCGLRVTDSSVDPETNRHTLDFVLSRDLEPNVSPVYEAWPKMPGDVSKIAYILFKKETTHSRVPSF